MCSANLAWRHLLAEGAACFDIHLSEKQIDLFQVYAQELLAWNRRINLTTITAPAEVAIKHFVDSLAGEGELQTGWRVIDLGSGGGFPGIPLKILRPDLTITLVDAVRKKTSFQKQACRQLGLKDIWAVHARIENLAHAPDHKNRYDAVVTRALTNLPRLCELSAPLLNATGVIIAYRGRTEADVDGASISPAEGPARAWRLNTRSYRLPHMEDCRSITRCERLPREPTS
jgi:16S rRNA (guanine527-N7)-methyltransferase